MSDTATTSVRVLDDPGRVATLLPALRRRILSELGGPSPDSAAGLARRLALPRQKINYHLRKLEQAGLVECVEERRVRGCVERLLKTSARAFLINPDVLEGLSVDPEMVRDRFSSAYLMASASKMTRDVAVLRERSEGAGKRLVTMTVESEVSFASPADLESFTSELNKEVSRLVAKYHRTAPGSRAYRFLVGAHPTITKSEEEAVRERRK